MCLLDSKAELLRFGGEVMKNVAGYDLSRLNVGALGTLGLIVEVSLKVWPMRQQVKPFGLRWMRQTRLSI
jgi:FAD/FMN-containing dehydrogenase